jgi:hypothetical protein
MRMPIEAAGGHATAFRDPGQEGSAPLNPAVFKAIAKRLSADPIDRFLEKHLHYKRDELTTRQAERLLVLRVRVEIHFNIRGLSVAKLIAACHQKSARSRRRRPRSDRRAQSGGPQLRVWQ